MIRIKLWWLWNEIKEELSYGYRFYKENPLDLVALVVSMTK
jgi:hypothetical protein